MDTERCAYFLYERKLWELVFVNDINDTINITHATHNILLPQEMVAIVNILWNKRYTNHPFPRGVITNTQNDRQHTRCGADAVVKR